MSKYIGKEKLMEVFSQRLNDLLIDQNKTGNWLAETTGISAPRISNYIRGKESVPSALNLRNIAEALNVSCDYLLGLTDSQKQVDDPQRVAVDYTGLNDKAALHLRKLATSSFIGSAFLLAFISHLAYGNNQFPFIEAWLYNNALDRCIEHQKKLLNIIQETNPTKDDLFGDELFSKYEKCLNLYEKKQFGYFKAVEEYKKYISRFFGEKENDCEELHDNIHSLF